MNDYEVGAAASTDVTVYGPAEVAERISEDDDAAGRHALVVGNPDARAYAVLGSLEEIREWLSRAIEAVDLATMSADVILVDEVQRYKAQGLSLPDELPALVVGPMETLPVVAAIRTTEANARHHFERGGSVVVSEHSAMLYPVWPNTVTVDKTRMAWAELREVVEGWRSRYPNQRYFIVPGTTEADRDELQAQYVDVATVLDLLGAASVPYRPVDTGGGCITVYVGPGEFDEATEAWPQRLSIGPCYLTVGPATRTAGARLAGTVGELSYGDRDDGVTVYEPTAPDVIAAALITAYQTTPKPKPLHEMWPVGRVVFYEGDDPAGFRAEMQRVYGFDPAGNQVAFDEWVSREYGVTWRGGPFQEERGYPFLCPPQHLDEVYGSGRYQLGS